MKNRACLHASFVLLLLAPAMAQESYDQLLHHWDYDKSAPLDIKQSSVRDRDGVKVYEITYASPVGDRGAAVGPAGGVVTASEDNTPLNDQQVAVEVQQDVNLRRGADLLLARKDVDPKRLAYAGHSCDANAGGFLSGIDKRFKAFVIMAGELSDEVDKKTKPFQQYREKIGPEKVDAFMAKQYLEIVSEPKKLKIYQAPHALNAEATRDRIAFLSEQLSVKPPDAKAVAAIPALIQPPWPKQ